MPFFHVQETPYKKKRKGVQIKSFSGEHIQMTFILLDSGFVSRHSHSEEQIGYVLSGEVEIVIGKEKMEYARGDGYYIPAETPHSFRVLLGQPVELIEIFSPPKEENRI